MMYCPSCGKQLIEGGKFCLYCGKAVPTAPLDAASPPDVPDVPSTQPAAAQVTPMASVREPATDALAIENKQPVLQDAAPMATLPVQQPKVIVKPEPQAHTPAEKTVIYQEQKSSRLPLVLVLFAAVLLIGSALLFWLLRPGMDGSSVLVGKWYIDTSQVIPTATSTGDKFVDVFGKAVTGWKCATADSLEFLADGTISASTALGSGAGRYDVIEGNRLRIESPNGAALWTFSVDGDVLTIRSEEGCPDTRWRRTPTQAGSIPEQTSAAPSEPTEPISTPEVVALAPTNTAVTQHSNISAPSLVHTLRGHRDAVNSVAWSPDGQTLVSGSYDGTIKLWRVSDGSQIHTLNDDLGPVYSVEFSSDNQMLASGSDRDPSGSWNTLKLWNVSNGALIRAIANDSTSFVSDIAFSPDGQMIASGSEDKTVRLWRVSDGKEMRILSGHTDVVQSVAFSPDGQSLASSSSDMTIKLWRVSDGTEIRTLSFETTKNIVNSIAWSPDGQMLAAGTENPVISLWSLSDGAQISSLAGHTAAVNSVAFSPDGLLASGSSDSTIKLWGGPEGKLLFTLTGHVWPVTSVAWSPDGQMLASGSTAGTIQLWKVK